MLRANFHTHTTLCDGADSPEAMAAEAFARGFTHLGFSGHMDPDISMDWAAYLARIAALREEYRGRMDILCGVELDQDWAGEPVTGAEYIIGSTHFLPGAEGRPVAIDSSFELLDSLCRERFGGDWYALCAGYFQAEARVAARTGCQIVGHFDLVARFNHQFPRFDEEDPRYLGPALEAMTALAETGVAFELNCGAFNRGRRRDFYPALPLLRRLHSLGAPLFISSDAHSRALLDGGFPEALARAEACGWRTVRILAHGEDGAVRQQELPIADLMGI